ncbi:3-hydroxyacyl-CoA dehydrogenase family protein [Candidatus Frankia alpina]|uniref:3-hydroxyacyl-CoA dehydrogenase family protein n=1 Tax=Candidatus Frankia alpina TaxID=2699483 RepID=UPI001F4431AD|nr:3-hydroxyacyl-CoA dehydrogenase family protein [Candidatus Frankia alpina]
MTAGDNPAGVGAVGTVGVIGAGVIGSGIAQAVAVAGGAVVCVDTSAAARERARRQLVEGRFGLRAAVERGKLAAADVDRVATRIAWESELSAVAGATVVIEAVPEDLALKVRVFRELDRAAAASAVLATNSSGFPVGALAATTDRPTRVLGWHWSSPAQIMRFAEIVVTEHTDPDAVETVTRLAHGLGKNPIIVRDAPMAWGYVANRVYWAAVAEARRIVAEGVSTERDVDQLLVDCFRWPVGPFTMIQGATAGWT